MDNFSKEKVVLKSYQTKEEYHKELNALQVLSPDHAPKLLKGRCDEVDRPPYMLAMER